MKYMFVNAILIYLRYFAQQTLKKNKPTIIGITGSAGKSSARQILYAILKDHFPTSVVKENSEIGLPLGILGIKTKSLGFETPLVSILDWLRVICLAPFVTNRLQGVKYLIVEMGIDDPFPPKNMEYLLTIMKPDISIVLNVSPVHIMQFEKLLQKGQHNFKNESEKIDFLVSKIAEEKVKIITQSECSIGIFNDDNSFIKDTLAHWDNNNNTQLLSFGKSSRNKISYKEYSVSLEGTKFTYELDNEDMTVTMKKHLLPKTYQETIAAAILTARQCNLSPLQITTSLERNFSLPKSRSSLIHGINDSIIIDSSYNASRNATEGMIDLLATLKKQTKRPTVFVFGDMRELGNEAKHEHEIIAHKLIGVVDYLYCVGPLTREYVVQYLNLQLSTIYEHFKEIRWFDNAHRAGDYLQKSLPKEALVLVKGSQNTIFLEEAIKKILANPEDTSLLCRQESYWLARKKF